MKSDDSISALLIAVTPVTPHHTVNDVADLFLIPENKKLLCWPIVSDDRLLVGTLSRQRLQDIFMTRFGRELYGRHKVTTVMNAAPLTVDKALSVEDAAEYVSAKIEIPITEDFIIVDNGRYLGIGFVLDLLKAIEERVHARNSELADAYRHLKESQAQLIQSEKMASLGQMVAGVAHEINTPLGYVRNNVELTRSTIIEVHKILNAFENTFTLIVSGTVDENTLQTEIEQLEQMRTDFYEVSLLDDLEQLFDDTLYGIEQISEIVLGLKNFSRLDQAAVANVNVNQCIENTLIIAKNVLKHKCDVIKQFGELPFISCSPSQINQVFLNLLTNAAQAIEEYGAITITTWSEGDYVHARVTDSGKGISKENLSKIFDPFFTTKPIGQGTGLGLSIVYNIIEQHHGLIKVTSEIGQGAQFTVSLPCARNGKNISATSKSESEAKISTVASAAAPLSVDILNTFQPKAEIQTQFANAATVITEPKLEFTESNLFLPEAVSIEPNVSQISGYLKLIGILVVVSALGGIWFFGTSSSTKIPELPVPTPQVTKIKPAQQITQPKPIEQKIVNSPPVPTPQAAVQQPRVEQILPEPRVLQSTKPADILALSPENLSALLAATPQPIRQEAEIKLYAYVQKISKRNSLSNWEAYRRLAILNPDKYFYRNKAAFFAQRIKK